MARITKGSRASLPAVVLVVVTLVGVGGVPAGVGRAPRTGLLPTVVCERYEDLRAVDGQFLGPEVFDLDRDELAGVQAERRALVRELARRTTGHLGAFLHDLALWQASFDAAILDDWEAERRRLADEGWTSWHWRRELVDEDEVRDPDGEVVGYDDVGYYISHIDQRLAVECYAPELVDGPIEDLAGDPADGRLLFHRVDLQAEDFSGRLVSIAATGADEDPWPDRGYTSIGHYDVAPDGDIALATLPRLGISSGLSIAGRRGVLRRQVPTPGVTKPACPAWDDRGERLLVIDELAAADDRVLHLADPDGEVAFRRLDLPLAVAGCSDFLGDDRLVVGEAATDLDSPDRGVWTVGVDGSDPAEIYAGADCVTQVGGVDPAGERVAIAQSCPDVVSSGIVVVDLASGDVTRVATGYAALPRWSPDGRWLAFGMIALGQAAPISAWIARSDGTGLRQVVEGPASFPGWLPEE